jgi:hypothetical protein
MVYLAQCLLGGRDCFTSLPRLEGGNTLIFMPLKFELTTDEKKIVVFLLSLLLIGATLTLVRSKVL